MAEAGSVATDFSGDLSARAKGLSSELIDLRRSIHRNPELGFEEFDTRALIRRFLEEKVPDAEFETVARTGLLVSLPGNGPRVLLRACLDALPIQDTKDVEYASQVPGKSHACGHDGQVARLAGALALLGAQPRKANVYALFQPAEEIDEGAKVVLDEGVLKRVKPDIAFGFHGHPDLPAGTIGLKSGPIMASITTMRCQLQGREGHAAEPHLSLDPITAAASIIVDWQVALARRIDPRESIVLSIGRLSSGTASNIIPGQAELQGTLRVLDPSHYDEVVRVLRDVAHGVESKLGTAVDLGLDLVVPAVVNDPAATELVRKATVSALGSDAVVQATPSLGGDDFAWFLGEVTGAYFFVGEQLKDRPKYGWHASSYDLDETSLASGGAVLAQIVDSLGRETM